VTLKKILLEGENEERASLFWSADPAEWSPIASPSTNLTHPIPLTANDYLQQQASYASLSTDLKETTGGQRVKIVTAQKRGRTTKETTFASWLHRWLVAIIVVFLLIGLIGALLSSFLFPGG